MAKAHSSPVVGTAALEPEDGAARRLALADDLLLAAKGGGLSFVGRVFEYTLRFLMGIIVARALGVEQVGLFSLGTSVVLITANMGLLGLQTGLIRFLPPAIRERNTGAIWGLILFGLAFPAAASLALSVGVFFSADLLATLAFHDPRLTPVIRLFCAIIPLDTIGSMAYVIILSFKRPQYIVMVNNFIAPAVRFTLTLGLLAIGQALAGVIVAQVLGTAVGLALLLRYLNRLFPLRRALRSAVVDPLGLLRYSLPVHMGWMVNTVRGMLEPLILGMLGLTAGVGVFTVAARFTGIGSMFYLAIGNISTPILADLHSRGDHAQLKSYYQTTTRWLALFNLPLFFMLVMFARPLMALFGEDFDAGVPALALMACGTLVFTITGLGSNMLDMTDHPKVNTVNSVLVMLITLGLDIALIPAFGVMGAALAIAGSTVVMNIIRLLEVWRLVKMQPYNRYILRPALAAVIAAAAAFPVARFVQLPSVPYLVLGAGVLWGVYALALAALGLPAEDRAVLAGLAARLPLRRWVK